MASGLSRRVESIRRAAALLSHLHQRMSHLQPTMAGLIQSASELDAFAGLDFLGMCQRGMREGTPFPTAWREALKESSSMEGAPREILLELGEVLGSSSLESGLSSLEFARRRMELELEAAREKRDKYTKLYRTLGVLGGFAIALILM